MPQYKTKIWWNKTMKGNSITICCCKEVILRVHQLRSSQQMWWQLSDYLSKLWGFRIKCTIPSGSQRKAFCTKYTEPFSDPQNVWGFYTIYAEPSGSGRNSWWFRIEYIWNYLVMCRTCEGFGSNIHNHLVINRMFEGFML